MLKVHISVRHRMQNIVVTWYKECSMVGQHMLKSPTHWGYINQLHINATAWNSWSRHIIARCTKNCVCLAVLGNVQMMLRGPIRHYFKLWIQYTIKNTGCTVRQHTQHTYTHARTCTHTYTDTDTDIHRHTHVTIQNLYRNLIAMGMLSRRNVEPIEVMPTRPPDSAPREAPSLLLGSYRNTI